MEEVKDVCLVPLYQELIFCPYEFPKELTICPYKSTETFPVSKQTLSKLIQ